MGHSGEPDIREGSYMSHIILHKFQGLAFFMMLLLAEMILKVTSHYPASRVSFGLPRHIGKSKETLRAASRFPIEHAPTQM